MCGGLRNLWLVTLKRIVFNLVNITKKPPIFGGFFIYKTKVRILFAMAGPSAARGNSALGAAGHGGEASRPAMRSASSPRGNGPLCSASHGGKSTRPAVRGAAALRSHRPTLGCAHRGKTTRQAVKSASTQRRNFAPLFWIHGGETAPRFALAAGVVTAAAARSRGIVILFIVESL